MDTVILATCVMLMLLTQHHPGDCVNRSLITRCPQDDFECFESTLMASTLEAQTLLPAYTNPDHYDEECAMYRLLKDCAEAEHEPEGCDGAYRHPDDHPPEDLMATFKAICADPDRYVEAYDCISNMLIRAHAHLCMGYVLHRLAPPYLDDFCSLLEKGWKCVWYLIDDRCGSEINSFVDRVHNSSLTLLVRDNGCDVSIGSDQNIYITLGLVFLAFIFIPLVVRLIWCPPDTMDNVHVVVMDRSGHAWPQAAKSP